MVGSRDSFWQRAQVLEKRGQSDAAIQAYLNIGALSDAARVFANTGRYIKAAELLMTSVGVDLEHVSTLGPDEQRSACTAAQCFIKGGDLNHAIRIFIALGDFRAGAELLEKANRNQDAAEVFLKAGDRLAAARCHAKHGQFVAALDVLLGVVSSEQDYRLACVEISKLATALKDSSHRVKQFALPFERSLPLNPDESQALQRLATLWGPAERSRPDTAATLNGQARHVTLERPGEIPGFSVGKVIADRYRVEAELGGGSFSRVFRAFDLMLNDNVVLKVLLRNADESSVSNFQQELKLTRQLTHPNIIRIFDIGIHQEHRFFTMEFLIGTDLKTQLGSGLSIGKALNYLAQACAGLQTAHQQGIVHRDIKPDNFFITADEKLKIVDFGLARHDRGGFDAEGLVAGTPQYMAPEQIQNFEQVGPSADLYSLGVVAYEMLAHHVPFLSADLQQLLWMQMNATPESTRLSNPDVPEDLDRIILKMLEKSPARRLPSAHALANAIEPIRERFLIDDFF